MAAECEMIYCPVTARFFSGFLHPSQESVVAAGRFIFSLARMVGARIYGA
jgi:hypothetical protein